MQDVPLYIKITDKRTVIDKSERHTVTQYIDNSNICIGANNMVNVKKHTEAYLVLHQKYYKANRLKMKGEKTRFIVVNLASRETDEKG